MIAKQLLGGCYVHGVKYLETSRGVAFSGILTMDGEDIGMVENSGTGGATTIQLHEPDKREELTKRIEAHFVENGKWEKYQTMADEFFANELLDVHDFGKVLTDEDRDQLLNSK